MPDRNDEQAGAGAEGDRDPGADVAGHEHVHGEACAHDHGHGEGEGGKHALPEPSLQLHLFHLASQVTMALGEIENPLTGKRDKDLPTARFLIDLIAMLERKTAGNRTEEEDAYMRGVLTNLRMAYVAKSK
ncbi:MAG TPA: DUF1844 domain-containing protein [Planctomycetota bacterium]|nr:DUF1844 domain-containing protein [Planctomycetota bacterium]